MKAIIEVVAGKDKGKQIAIKKHQVMIFGRTEWADVSFPSDPQMSGKHFSVENDGAQLKIRDLASTNGTRVNGQFVETANLQSGDQIDAGLTTYTARIESTSDSAPRAEPASETAPQNSSASPVASPIVAAQQPAPNTPAPAPANPARQSEIPQAPSPTVPTTPSPSPSSPVAPKSPSAAPANSIEEVPSSASPIVNPIVMPPPGDQGKDYGAAGSSPIVIPDSFAQPPSNAAPPSAEIAPVVSTSQPASGGADIEPTPKPPPHQTETEPFARPPAQQRSCTAAQTRGGFTTYVNSFDAQSGANPPPSTILAQLSALGTPILITHHAKIGKAFPKEDLASARPLFTWLPEEMARDNGPVIFATSDVANSPKLLDLLWDKDAVICLFSTDADATIEHLLGLVSNDANSMGNRPSTVFGFCWPNVLQQLFQLAEKDVVEKVLEASTVAALIEDPAQPGSWQILAKGPQVEPVLAQLGYAITPVPSASEPEGGPPLDDHPDADS